MPKTGVEFQNRAKTPTCREVKKTQQYWRKTGTTVLYYRRG